MTAVPVAAANQLLAAAKDATPGPWRHDWTVVPPQVRADEPTMHCVTADIPPGEAGSGVMRAIIHAREGFQPRAAEDAEFIALCREHAPVIAQALIDAHEVIEHVLRHGQVGKQTERRLRAALAGAAGADNNQAGER